MAVSQRPKGRAAAGRHNKSLSPRARVAVVVFCLAIVGGVGYFVVYPYALAAYYGRRAEWASNDRDFARAREHLTRVLEAWPHSGETLFLLARTCRRAGDFDAAQTYLAQAREHYWDKQRLDLEKSLLQAQAGAVGPVEPTLRGYLAAGHPDEKDILEALIAGNLEAKSPQGAYQWACVWLDRHPDDWQAHYWKGLAYEAGLRLDLAAEEFQKALERKPGHAESHLRLAEVLSRKGSPAEAAAHDRQCLAAEPDNAAALYGLARCQRSLGEGESARQTLERLFAVQPDHAGGLRLRGQLEIDADRPADAVAWLRRAHERLPNDLDANKALADCYRLLNQPEAARDYERRVQEIRRDLQRMETITKDVLSRPQDVALRREAGTILMRLGQPGEAAHWLGSALLLDPKDGPTRTALAQCVRELGDAKLMESYRRLLELPPDAAANRNR